MATETRPRLIKRAKGLEPSTASLEGWRSTIELRPRIIDAAPSMIANLLALATVFSTSAA